MIETTSTAPNGEQFPLPTQQDEAAELQRLQALVADSVRKGTDFKSVPFPGVQRHPPDPTGKSRC